MPTPARGTPAPPAGRRTSSGAVRSAATLVSLLALAGVGLAGAPAADAADDYPYRTDRSWSADPWGMTKRQCVSFVAFRLAQHHSPLAGRVRAWGDAGAWDGGAWAAHLRVSARPVVGTVAQWRPWERSVAYVGRSGRSRATFVAGPVGHVAYVRAVYRDGSVAVEQYNGDGSRSYSVMHLRAPRYLYLGGR